MFYMSEFFGSNVVLKLIYMINNFYFHEGQNIVFLKNKIKFSSRDRIIFFYKHISLSIIVFCYECFSFFTFFFFILRVHVLLYQINLLIKYFMYLISIDTLPYVGNVFDSTILIFQIIRVFSYIYSKQSFFIGCKRTSSIAGIHNF